MTRGSDAATTLSEFGRDVDEDREIGDHPKLLTAIGLARDEDRWSEAAPVFAELARRHPDWDVPVLWSSEYQFSSGDAAGSVETLIAAARNTRRRSILLARAGERALMELRALDTALRRLAQSVYAYQRLPAPRDLAAQRVFLVLGQVYAVLGDSEGARWAGSIQDVTSLSPELEAEIAEATEQGLRTSDLGLTDLRARSRADREWLAADLT